jgi:hypothetical protein
MCSQMLGTIEEILFTRAGAFARAADYEPAESETTRFFNQGQSSCTAVQR